MVLDLSLQSDCLKAEVYFAKLVKDQSAIELKKINKRRTNSQNRYLHVLFAIFGNEFGYTIDECKIAVKRALKYTYKKNGHTFLKKTSDMTVDELSRFIDRFRDFSAYHGCYLPSADEYDKDYVLYEKEVQKAER